MLLKKNSYSCCAEGRLHMSENTTIRFTAGKTFSFRRDFRFLFPILLFIFCFHNLSAQTDSITGCPVKDISDVIRGNKEKKEKTEKSYYLLVTPVISSSPATGFVIGAAAQITFKKNPTDKYSLISANAQYTTKNQALFNIKNNVLLSNNKLFLSGDWRLFLFSQPTYGLGTDVLNTLREGGTVVGDEGVDPDSLAQPMKFNYFKFHQTASWNFSGHMYLGGGIHIDVYDNIVDEKLDLAAGDTTAHYKYSVEHGFNPNHYAVEGLSVNGIYDSRDNQINATKGWFANVNWRFNPKLSSNQKSSSFLYAEMRYFKSFRVGKSQHTIGVWAWGNFLTTGEAPYLVLPSIGWDQRSRSGRGYPQGMFRGESMAYGEFEYRFPLTCNQLFSAVIFGNLTTASDRDRDVRLFQYIQPAIGFGVRINMDKLSRTNLVLDYAKGRKTGGFYLNAGETF